MNGSSHRLTFAACSLFLLAAAGCTWSLLGRAPLRALAGGTAASSNVVRQGFPAKSYNPAAPEKSDTLWEVEWEITQKKNGPAGSGSPPSSVLKILTAKFMYKDRAGLPSWITVVRDLELGEVFVPYDPGSPRYRDVSQFAFWILPADPRLLGPPCVARGEILSSVDPDMTHKVYKEVHDDGLRWLNDGGGDDADRGRRGEKLLLWAVFYAANYRYIIEYGFTDDGSITCRLGATARNHASRQSNQSDVHLHTCCWMFEPDLGDPTAARPGGPDKNLVQLVRRIPRSPGVADGKFRVDVRPFGTPPGTPPTNPAFEGSAQWVAEEFTTLRIESTERRNGNDNPQPTAYDLLPTRAGAVRNFPTSFDFVNYDIWVTGEVTGPSLYVLVPTYVHSPPRPINHAKVKVWHNSPVWHVPRAEDFAPDGVSNFPHVALTMWASFTLRPRNLFDSTPLFAP